MLLNGADQSVPAGQIDGSHAMKVTCEVALVEEIREDELVERGGTDVKPFANANELTDQCTWDDHVSEAQSRKYGLTQRSHVDHPCICIHALHGAKRPC